jgi:hypothetical protein
VAVTRSFQLRAQSTQPRCTSGGIKATSARFQDTAMNWWRRRQHPGRRSLNATRQQPPAAACQQAGWNEVKPSQPGSSE